MCARVLSQELKFDFHWASWLSSCVTPPPPPPTRCLNMRSKSATYCFSASRWWLWLVLLWICCGGAASWPGCCRGWLVGTVQRQGLGMKEGPPGPAVTVVPLLAKLWELASCSQPCWRLVGVSVSPVLHLWARIDCCEPDSSSSL